MRDTIAHPITFEEKLRALDWALNVYSDWLQKSMICGDTKGSALLAIKADLIQYHKEDVT